MTRPNRPPHRYTPAEDIRIREAFALPPRSHARLTAFRALARELGTTPSGLRSRYHQARVKAGEPIPPQRGTRIGHPPVDITSAPVLTLPVVERPAWMTMPITRERLMAGR